MHTRQTIFPLIFLFSVYACVNSQNKQVQAFKLVGGACEGCEAIFEYDTTQRLSSIDTLPDFQDEGTQIKITGTIYQNDEKTPAKEVILYAYHTNQQGIYPVAANAQGWDKRHGYIRGWIKTDEKGQYTFYTLKPGIYPSRNAAAHVHLIILEPNGQYYWLEDFYFEGDSLLSQQNLNPKSPRGGYNSVLNLKKEDNILTGRKNIILGKNIPEWQ